MQEERSSLSRKSSSSILFSFQLCHDTKLSKSLEKMIAFAQTGTRTLAFFSQQVAPSVSFRGLV